jgi:hypothetical protein
MAFVITEGNPVWLIVSVPFNVDRYHWSLLDYLPPAVKETMELFLNEFVYLPWREVRRAMASGNEGLADISTQVDATRLEEVQVKWHAAVMIMFFCEAYVC